MIDDPDRMKPVDIEQQEEKPPLDDPGDIVERLLEGRNGSPYADDE